MAPLLSSWHTQKNSFGYSTPRLSSDYTLGTSTPRIDFSLRAFETLSEKDQIPSAVDPRLGFMIPLGTVGLPAWITLLKESLSESTVTVSVIHPLFFLGRQQVGPHMFSLCLLLDGQKAPHHTRNSRSRKLITQRHKHHRQSLHHSSLELRSKVFRITVPMRCVFCHN
jgi:hypothetical protein